MKSIDVKSFDKKHAQDLENYANKGQFDDKEVIISNELVRQNIKITLEEEKLMHCIFSQLNGLENKAQKRVIKLYKNDLFDLLSLTSSTRYIELKKRFKSLTEKSVVDVVLPNGNDLIAPVIVGIESNYKADHFIVELNERFMPYLERLVTHYTKLELDSIVQFESKYSLILYKYLSSWRSNHYHRMTHLTTKELKELFGLTKDDYVYKGKFQRTHFERKTLETAINEINDKVPYWGVRYEKTKRGGRVTGYTIEWLERNRLSTHNQSVSQEELLRDYEQYTKSETEE